jgi:hypothetical protein
VTDEQMFAAQTEFYGAPTLLQLWDMTEAGVGSTTSEGLAQFVAKAARLGQERAGGKTAVVVRSDLQFGLARMSEAFAASHPLPYTLRVFRDRDQALAWLTGPDTGKP